MLTDLGGSYGKYIALAIFIAASLTDMLDVKIARKYNLVKMCIRDRRRSV